MLKASLLIVGDDATLLRLQSGMPVSYTHLDVYKRQVRRRARDLPGRLWALRHYMHLHTCLLYTSRCV